jgi:L-asparaginase / beta-aspartyl-peptidase
VLEDDPLFDAGYGSFVNVQGEVEMDALLADGNGIHFGAVAAVRRVRYPISLARLVLTQTDNCFFVGEGADQLAAELGMPLIPNSLMITPAEFDLFRQRQANGSASRAGLGTGTVGAVALDVNGHIASATSTGGVPDKRKGRVGDSPLFGAGGYADDAFGGASATGRGENIMRFFLSQRVVEAIREGTDAQKAAREGLALLSGRVPDPEAGIIVIGADGSLGAAHSTPAMPIAWLTAEGDIQVAMRYNGAFG